MQKNVKSFPQPTDPPASDRPGRVVCPKCHGYRVLQHFNGYVPCEKCDDGTIPIENEAQ